jgi:C-terminal processing protease CtpA/Prc
LRRIGPLPILAGLGGARASLAFDESDYMAPLNALQWARVRDNAVLGFGARSPIFAPPDGFIQRLGRAQSDEFYSGTFSAGGYTIGFIRIPTFGPSNTNLAYQQFANEILYFQQNTDGLIIDVMRNPGGAVTYCNSLIQFLMPQNHRVIGFEIRATTDWVNSITSSVQSAKAQGAPQWTIDLLLAIQDQIVSANRELRGRTGPIPLDDVSLDRQPLTDVQGNVFAYTKPIMVLTDEFSASAADLFPATIQLNRRGSLFGVRTMGAGGSVGSWRAGVYGEGSAGLTMSLMNRGELVSIDGYPATPYIENVGVHPDITADYMTRDNLLSGGRPFVDSFVAAMVENIRKNK